MIQTSVTGPGETVGDVIDAFMRAKGRAHDRGELAWITLRDYRHCAATVKGQLGEDTRVGELSPGDFSDLLATADRLSVHQRRKLVVQARTMFKWAKAAKRIPEPDFGPDFKAPPAKAMRRARREAGPRHLTPPECRRLVGHATGLMRVAVLLGLNAGFGNNDLATLLASSVDLDTGWLDQPRTKTEADRLAPLWPETWTAIHAIRGPRKLLLVNRRGKPLVRPGTDELGRLARPLLDLVGLTERTFYDLRRTFATYAAEVADEHASRIVMGHTIDGVHASYIQTFPRRRLYRVVFHVRERMGLGSTETP